MRKELAWFPVLVATVASCPLFAATIGIDGRLADSTESSALEWGDNTSRSDTSGTGASADPFTNVPDPVSVNDGTVALSFSANGQGWRTQYSAGSYDAGEEWNVRSSYSATSAAGALTQGAYYEISLDSSVNASALFTWDSVSVSLWRNGSGADTHFQLAVDADGNGFTVDDLVGSAVTPTDGIAGATTISYNGADLPDNTTSATVRLYHWGQSSINGNIHIYDLVADYTSNSSPEPVVADRPNVILIFMDDMGYNDIGAFTYPEAPNQYPVSGPTPNPGSSNSDIPEPNEAYGLTPRIDSLADNGLKMTQFYATPRCSQSRAALLTGRYEPRNGVTDVFYPNDTTGLHTSEVTIPEVLRQEGYATAMVGKWHLGYNPSRHNPFQMMPLRHGFHEFLGYPHSNDMNSLNLIRDESIELADFSSATEQAQITWRYTEAAIDFIQRTTAEDKPFFLYLAHTMTHRPTYPSDQEYTNADGSIWPKFQGTSGVSYYYDVVKEVDHSTGRILDKLEELGIDEETLVIFTSDNGPWTRLSSLNLTASAVGSAYPLRDGKGTTWEGGCRVPFVAQWPNTIPAGSVSGEVSGIIDFFPTLVALAGGEVPSDRTIDGIDLTGLWKGEGGWSNPRSAYALFSGTSVSAVMQGDYKLRGSSLYNLASDIQESSNISGSEPTILAELQAETTAISTSIANDQNTFGAFTAYEVLLSDNDIMVSEGDTATVEVRLSADPGKTVIVTVARFLGDSDLSITGGSSLTFTSSDWDQEQTVTLAAAQDVDGLHSGTTFRLTTDDIVPVRELFAFEVDDEADPTVVASLVWPKIDSLETSELTTTLIAEGSVQLGVETDPEGALYEWRKISGPGDVTFTDSNSRKTGVVFSTAGTYLLRFKAEQSSDGGFDAADFTVVVDPVEVPATWGDYKYGPAIGYDANTDDDGDALWDNEVTPGSRDWSMDSSVTQTVSDPAAQLDFIEAAWSFPGGAIPDGGTSNHLDAYGSGSASIEFWFKPDSLPVGTPQVLWESGGDTGASITLSGSQIRFTVDQSGSGALAEATLVPAAAQDGFVHCVGVIDLANDQIHLYIDGALEDTEAIAAVSDWCGTSQLGLGTMVHSNGSETTDTSHLGGNILLSGSYTTFHGLIAHMLFYDKVLSTSEVLDLSSGPRGSSVGGATNVAPVVSAGANQSVSYTAGAALSGSATDDGLPQSSNLTALWTLSDGPGNASFSDSSELSTQGSFDLPGNHTLWLEVDDGEIKVYDEVIISVAGFSYDEWATAYSFPASQDGFSDDPDGDRWANGWEWLVGSNPLEFDGAGSFLSVDVNASEESFSAVFDFLIPRNRVPSLVLESSETLAVDSWNEVIGVVPLIEVLDASTERWKFSVSVDPENSDKYFVRPKLSE